MEVPEAFPHAAENVAVSDRHDNEVRSFPPQLLANLERDRLLALTGDGVVARVAIIVAVTFRRRHAERERLVVASIHLVDFRAEHQELGGLRGWDRAGDVEAAADAEGG